MLRFYKYFMFSITRNFLQTITSDNFTIFWLIFIKHVAWKASKPCPHTANVNDTVLLKSKVGNSQYICCLFQYYTLPKDPTRFLSIILFPTISNYSMINLLEENRFESKNFFYWSIKVGTYAERKQERKKTCQYA